MEEIKHESTDTIMNELVEKEKMLIQLRKEEFELANPLSVIRFNINQLKSEISILNKRYWSIKG